MTTLKKHYLLAGLITAAILISSCRKGFLDTKPDASLVVPSTLQDFQALLDNVNYMNGATPRTLGGFGIYGGPNPMLLEVAADNYYIPDNLYSTLSPFSKNVYVWSRNDAYGGELSLTEWSFPYRAIFYANVVLDGLEKNETTVLNEADWNRVKGSALFYRAHSFYQLSQVFAPPYQRNKAKDLLGIPLRLKSDISAKTIRANLEETYNQIINDLKACVEMLPNEPLYKTRPSKPAALALLARVYLSMSDYANAAINAEKCIVSYKSTLLDYNALSTSKSYPLLQFNDEVLFSGIANNMPEIRLWSVSTSRIDPLLYQSFADNDLRKVLFFREREPGQYSFKGSYDGNAYPFFGIALDEVYFILAESLIREYKIKDGLQYVNKLLKTRFKTVNGSSTYVAFETTDEEQALRYILKERRKQLMMRGLRLTDLRRLNMDPRFAKTLTRTVDGKVFELPPNDLRYTWPIPNDVIALTGIVQNPR